MPPFIACIIARVGSAAGPSDDIADSGCLLDGDDRARDETPDKRRMYRAWREWCASCDGARAAPDICQRLETGPAGAASSLRSFINPDE
jgi:hypothetical protein